jgi:pimeloyl-ACP methyl ester carboxylesterase
MAVNYFGRPSRREFFASSLAGTMVAISTPLYAGEDPVIPLATGPEVAAFKKAQEKLLAKSKVTAKSQFVKLTKPPLSAHVLDGGKGEPVLLIHGGNAMAVQFAPLFADIQSEFRWYAPDRPGCGLTDKFDYSKCPDFRKHGAEFIEGIMDALNLRRAHLIGSSMGGFWALAFALAKPDRVGKIVLLGEPAGSPPPDKTAPRPPAANGTSTIEKMRAGLRARLVANVDRVSIEMLDASVAAANLPGAQLSWNTMVDLVVNKPDPGCLTYSLRPELKNLKAPTLFVWGDKENLASRKMVEEMVPLAPNAQFKIVADAGHIVWFDQPEQCSKLTIDFLKSK